MMAAMLIYPPLWGMSAHSGIGLNKCSHSPRIWTLLIRLNPSLSVGRARTVYAIFHQTVQVISNHFFSVTIKRPGVMVSPALFVSR